MKKLTSLLLCVCLFSISDIFADNQTVTNSPQHEVLLGDMNDNSPGAEQYQPKLQPAPKFIQEQNAISNDYEKHQVQIEEEEDYYSGMGFGMFDGPIMY